MINIQKLQDEISQWSNETFGSEHRRLPIAKHLKEEAEEVVEVITKISAGNLNTDEYANLEVEAKYQAADCLILIMDLLSKFGFTMEEAFIAVKDKMEINKIREWETPNEEGICHHKTINI